MDTPTPAAPAHSHPEAPSVAQPRTERLVSVDALRGFDMFWIIGGESVAHALEKLSAGPVVSTIADQLKHAEWIGFHFFDVIFPLFLFLVGVSIVLSMERIIATTGRKAAFIRILRRSVLLFVVGVFYYGGLSKEWPDIALSGVLPRIALCYLAASSLYLLLPRKTLAATAGLLLIAYWAMLTFIPFPDVNVKHAGGGRKAVQAQAKTPGEILATASSTVKGTFEEGHNLVHYVDLRWLPGRKRNVYYTNEGLLSTISAIVTTLFGIMAGWVLIAKNSSGRQKAAWLVGAGAVAVVLGVLWSFQFPIIKRIWTSSFCLVASGCASALLGVFYLIVDVRGHQKWCRPFLWIGSNALAVYLAVNIVDFGALAARFAGGDVSRFLDSHVSAGAGGLVLALVGLALPLLLAKFLYDRKIFFRL